MYKRKGTGGPGHNKLHREARGAAGIGPTQLETLKVIEDRQRRYGASYLGEVARIMGLQQGATHQRFAALRQRGLIEDAPWGARPGPGNGARMVALTKAGREALR